MFSLSGFSFNSRNKSPENQGLSGNKLGLQKGRVEQYGDWTIEFTCKKVGTTIRRELYSVSITGKETYEKAYLSNFPTLGTARRAAYGKIGQLAAKYAESKERKRVDVKHSLAKQRRLKKLAAIKKNLSNPSQ